MSIISKKELSFESFLEESNVIDFVRNDRTQLADNQELDFYIPEYRLGFEINPSSSHGEFGLRSVSPYYHQNKALEARSRDLKLTHIYDWTDDLKSPVWANTAFSAYVQSLIIPNSIEIDAINEIDKEEAEAFIAEHDLFKSYMTMLPSGFLGLFAQGELVGVLIEESGTISKQLDNKLTYKYVGIPGFEVVNFWDVWGDSELILVSSLDYLQTLIPLNGLYQVMTAAPNIILCKGTGKNTQVLSFTDFVVREGSWVLDGDWRHFAHQEHYQIVHDSGYIVYSNRVII